MNMSAAMADSFADARPLAQHCAELTWRGPRPEERTEAIAAWCRDLANEVAQELAQLFSGGKLKASLPEPEFLLGKDVFERIGPIAVNSLLRCGDSDQTMLLSVDLATVTALTDASFGGAGTVPKEVPPQMPRSAAMLADQCASMIAQSIVTTNGAAEQTQGDVLVRSESASRLKPFGAEANVALFTLTIQMGSEAEWKLLLSVANDRLDALLPGEMGGAKPMAKSLQPSDGTQGTFAQLPMPIEAVLNEFDVTLGRLEKLAPGDEFPLAIASELPLRLGEKVLAHGALGTLDNRMAVRVTRIAFPGATAAAKPSPPENAA